MERRCLFLEKCPQLQNTGKFRSTLFNIMKEEIRHFSKLSMSLSSNSHKQV